MFFFLLFFFLFFSFFFFLFFLFLPAYSNRVHSRVASISRIVVDTSPVYTEYNISMH